MIYNEYFKNVIPKDIYSKLNKDKSINYHFRSDNVGKCAKIFDDFRKSGEKQTKAGWQKYYFKHRPKEPLKLASEYISKRYNINLDTAKNYVHYRVIGQTWNGMVTEFNVIRELEQVYHNIMFMKTDYEIDEEYFTDWEAYYMNSLVKGEVLLFGIQIKPISYDKMNHPYQLKAKQNHNIQAQAYKEKFKVPHIMIYYENGKIYEPQDLFNRINTMLVYSIKIKI